MQLDFYKGGGFLAEVIRTARRKTASVRVKEGKVFVVVPESLSNARINALLEKKSRWIREKFLLQKNAVPVLPRAYVSGECFPYLGGNYPLAVEAGKHAAVKLNGRTLEIQASSALFVIASNRVTKQPAAGVPSAAKGSHEITTGSFGAL